MSSTDFTHRTLPVIGKRVLRMGLAPSYGIDSAGVDWALDGGGVQYVFWTPRMKAATVPLRRALQRDRERFVVATGPTTAWWSGGIRRAVDRSRALLGVDQLDVLQVFWLGRTSRWTPAIAAELEALRDEGAVRAIGISIHDRKRAAELARTTSLDLLMIRYNAAHPGAEADIFPHLPEGRHTVVAYTATCWRRLLKRPEGWDGEVPTAGDCYRFCLSSPHVDVVLTGPKTLAELRENLTAFDRGPLDETGQTWMRDFGARAGGRGFDWL
ncbi:MAG: aldo/keto reductase [Thermoanaerobaculales bacterium]|nr:aldo/keto reductase [Thermoanaerobaculales bacterium]